MGDVPMIEIAVDKRGKLSKLFESYRWNFLVDAVLEDAVVSRAWADDAINPQVAVLELANIRLFIPGGDAYHPAARDFLEGLTGFAALIPASGDWEARIQETFTGRSVALPRYAFTSEKLDGKRLLKFSMKIPDGYSMVPMDIDLARRLAGEKSEFASDHLLNYESPEDFIARGFGFCILRAEEIVSAATTFVTCKAGIEIQINTREAHRGKGLATTAAARLLLHSLSLGLDPNWDAENKISVGLAKKLGYTPQGTYTLFVIPGAEN